MPRPTMEEVLNDPDHMGLLDDADTPESKTPTSRRPTEEEILAALDKVDKLDIPAREESKAMNVMQRVTRRPTMDEILDEPDPYGLLDIPAADTPKAMSPAVPEIEREHREDLVAEAQQYFDVVEQLECIFTTQEKEIYTDSRTPGSISDPAEQRIHAAFRAGHVERMAELAGRAEVIRTLAAQYPALDRQAIGAEIEQFRELAVQTYVGIEDFGGKITRRVPSWSGLPQGKVLAAEVRAYADEAGLAAGAQPADREDIRAMREAAAAAYRQEVEIRSRFPDAQGLTSLAYKTILKDHEAWDQIGQAAGNRLEVRHEIEAFAADRAKAAPERIRDFRERTAKILVSFANKLGISDGMRKSSAKLAANPPKTLGTAPITDDGTLDYKRCAELALSEAEKYERLAEGVTGARKKKIHRTINEIRSAAVTTRDAEVPNKSIRAEREQVKHVAAAINRLEALGAFFEDEGRVRVSDFSQAHNNRRRQAAEQLKAQRPTPPKAESIRM
ncbi:hypothetical protein [Citreimonas salinaria]|uniref:Uncharacterized protein n=1 Tax=Citreimonas salinaria TaxID=321339 RepID=A0A1H3N6N2_9RHOB|nr:hypothetical protein [Citreimonas salinaria]SDY84488.1 hypothetical protein SAMN05444340_1215 [Citreimonas salinaria]